jgi:elongation factor Ts
VEITASLVKELREKTGAGMMDCKKALAEVGGDMEQAVDYLRKKGLAAAAKKAGRIASEGLVGAYIAETGKIGAMVEINCETDFVARNPEFVDLISDLARQAAEKATAPEGTGEDLLAQPFVTDAAQTVNDVLNQKVAKIGEKIDFRRYARFQAEGNNMIGSYIHLGGKIGVLVELEANLDIAQLPEARDLARDVAMQIAASNPTFVRREEVPSAQIEAERKILAEQEDIKSKPEAVRPKIVEGRINKYFEQVCLLEQAYIKDPSQTVSDMLRVRGGALNAMVTVRRFTRYVLGEGIEKRQEDFAAEVMAQMGQK